MFDSFDFKRFRQLQFIQMGFKVLSVVAVVIGLLFLVSASASHYPWFLRFIGIFSILEGVMLFVNPQDLMRKMYDWYLDKASDQTFRASGIITVIFGTALLSWVV